MLVELPPKQDRDESDFISGCYSPLMKSQSNEVIYKMVLTHILKHWDESKTQLHPISIAMNP